MDLSVAFVNLDESQATEAALPRRLRIAELPAAGPGRTLGGHRVVESIPPTRAGRFNVDRIYTKYYALALSRHRKALDR
jgi:hypothetical protein